MLTLLLWQWWQCSPSRIWFVVGPGGASRLELQGLAQALAQLLHLPLACQENQDSPWRQLPVNLAHLQANCLLNVLLIISQASGFVCASQGGSRGEDWNWFVAVSVYSWKGGGSWGKGGGGGGGTGGPTLDRDGRTAK